MLVLCYVLSTCCVRAVWRLRVVLKDHVLRRNRRLKDKEKYVTTRSLAWFELKRRRFVVSVQVLCCWFRRVKDFEKELDSRLLYIICK